MPGRHSPDPEAAKKKVTPTNTTSACSNIKSGEIFTDIAGKQWRVGKSIGVGGFGEIYVASDVLNKEVGNDAPYVVKVEKHTNGPLFVEINCYLRIAKEDMIVEWKKMKNLPHLGMSHYIASGSHVVGEEKYRFLVMPKYAKDLETILKAKNTFNLKTVLTISHQITDVLEYIHSCGYVHSDIKAPNIMLGSMVQKAREMPIRSVRTMRTRNASIIIKKPKRLRNLRPINVVKYIDDIPDFDYFLKMMNDDKNSSPKSAVRNNNQAKNCDKIYLLDYGLASKYLLSSGEHKDFCPDERKAHAGTLMFCSRDAHKGAPSRRSDLESLGYNMIYWLTGSLPWAEDTDDPDRVERKKNKCLQDIPNFLNFCFNGECPKFLMDYFIYVGKLEFQQRPDYNFCRRLFSRAVTEYGYKDDLKLDLQNLSGWGKKQKRLKSRGRENIVPRLLISVKSPKLLLPSTISFKKPKLRRKNKEDKQILHDSLMNWSRILMDNPDDLLKAARVRKNTEGSDSGGPSIQDLDIAEMNPTQAMLDVYNRCLERGDNSPKHRGDSGMPHIEGYTPAMMQVYVRKMERELLEEERIANEARKRAKSTRKAPKRVGRHTKTKPAPSPTRTSPIKTRTRKAQAIVNTKKVVTKKAKTIPTGGRPYSLRG